MTSTEITPEEKNPRSKLTQLARGDAIAIATFAVALHLRPAERRLRALELAQVAHFDWRLELLRNLMKFDDNFVVAVVSLTLARLRAIRVDWRVGCICGLRVLSFGARNCVCVCVCVCVCS